MSRNLEVHKGVLHYCTFGFEAADDGKDNDQQNPSKIIM